MSERNFSSRFGFYFQPSPLGKERCDGWVLAWSVWICRTCDNKTKMANQPYNAEVEKLRLETPSSSLKLFDALFVLCQLHCLRSRYKWKPKFLKFYSFLVCCNGSLIIWDEGNIFQGICSGILRFCDENVVFLR